MADGKKERKRTKEWQNGDFCSGISQLHKRLDELRGYSCAIYKWSWFAWIALVGQCFTFCARAPYTLCTGRHFKPAQSLYTELLPHSVIACNCKSRWCHKAETCLMQFYTVIIIESCFSMRTLNLFLWLLFLDAVCFVLGTICFLVVFGTGAIFIVVIVCIYKSKAKVKEPAVVYDYISSPAGGIEMESNLSYVQRVQGLRQARERAEITPTKEN